MEQNLSLIWDKCLTFMRENLNAIEDKKDLEKLEKSFDMLFAGVQPLSLVDGNLTLLVPSDFYKEYIEENYLPILASALRKYIGKGVKLWYSVMENKPSGMQTPVTQTVKGNNVSTPKPQEVLPVAKKIVNPLIAPGIKKVNIESNLLPHLSFDDFVEGESNKFASNIARAIAKRPGATAFNPLFIYGNVGVGKTHIAHAIGLEVKKNFPDKVVLYMSSESFIQRFVESIRSKEGKAGFHNYFQMVDVLIIDDIQFLSGKDATQDSFFHIFDYLHQNGKQIVLTSDRAPVDIQDVKERVISRFKWGASAEVKSPDLVTRKKIIVDKLHRDGIVLTEDMLDFLAAKVNSNVRELIGVINSVIAYSTVYKSDLSLDLLKETIDKIASNQKEKKTINIPYIQEVVCEYFGISREQLLSKTRKREVALPRQLAMYFSKELTNSTYSKIGKEMGGKDHSTVMHACNTIGDVVNVDKEIQKYVKELKEKII
ncbi:MAG: chromosomal replication initiator protein DnaA [Bergeyella zoohelcum]|nr:chromosomal replication initiator protein DnaA [Bergeyella zoohelcum]